MKDFVNGGITEVFGWKPQTAKLIASLNDNLIEINYGKSITKYFITKTLNKVESKDEVSYFFQAIETSSRDNYTKNQKGKLKLVVNDNITDLESVLIFESDTIYFLLRGTNSN